MDELMDESPAPQPEPAATLTRADIVSELRASAARLDPAHAGHLSPYEHYRLLGAADLASKLLLAHCRYQRRRRGGRREHSSTVYALLDRTNQAQLVAALTLIEMAFWLLPARQQARGVSTLPRPGRCDRASRDRLVRTERPTRSPLYPPSRAREAAARVTRYSAVPRVVTRNAPGSRRGNAGLAFHNCCKGSQAVAP